MLDLNYTLIDKTPNVKYYSVDGVFSIEYSIEWSFSVSDDLDIESSSKYSDYKLSFKDGKDFSYQYVEDIPLDYFLYEDDLIDAATDLVYESDIINSIEKNINHTIKCTCLCYFDFDNLDFVDNKYNYDGEYISDNVSTTFNFKKSKILNYSLEKAE